MPVARLVAMQLAGSCAALQLLLTINHDCHDTWPAVACCRCAAVVYLCIVCIPQMAVLSPSEQALVIAARSQRYHSLQDIPDEAFPMFLSSKQYLAMLDATVAQPFLT